MKLSDFIKQLQIIESDLNPNAHPSISDTLKFYIDLPDDIVRLKLDCVDVDQAMGCGCWCGANIYLTLDDEQYELRRKDDHASRTDL